MSEIIIEGWVHKAGGGTKSKGWKRRYITVRGNKILYGPSPKNVAGSIDASTVTNIDYDDDAPGAPKKFKNFGFIIETEGRVYHMCAESSEDRDNYVVALQEWKLMCEDEKFAAPEEDTRSTGSHTQESNTNSTPSASPASSPHFSGLDERMKQMKAANSITATITSSRTPRRFGEQEIGDEDEEDFSEASHRSDTYNNTDTTSAGNRSSGKQKPLLSPSLHSQSAPDLRRFSSNSDSPTLAPLQHDDLAGGHVVGDYNDNNNDGDDNDDSSVGSSAESEALKAAAAKQEELIQPPGGFTINELYLIEKSMKPKDDEQVPKATAQQRTLKLKLVRDYLNLQVNAAVTKILSDAGEQKILFSDSIEKVNRRDKNDPRSIIVSMRNIFILEDEVLKQKIPFSEIQCLLLPATVAAAQLSSPSSESSVKCLVSVLMPKADKDLLFITNKHKEFIEHIQDAYQVSIGNELPVHIVEDVKSCTRRIIGEKPIKFTPISPNELIEGTAMDYAQITKNSDLRIKIRKTGDKKIIFSDLVDKVNVRGREQKRIIILTESALLSGTPTELNRRIDLVDIKRIVLENLDSISILIKVPSEYDIMFRTPRRLELMKCLIDGIKSITGESVQVSTEDDIVKGGILAKTEEFVKKMKAQRDPELIKNNIKKAIQSQDIKEIEKQIQNARAALFTDEAFIMMAQSEISKIKEKAEIRQSLERAQSEKDANTLRTLLQRANSLQMNEEVSRYKPQLDHLLKEKMIKQKIEAAIQSRDQDLINQVFEQATEFGMGHEVEAARLRLDKSLQVESTTQLLAECIKNHDSVRLRLALQNAKILGIENSDVAEAYKYVAEFQKEEKAKRMLMIAIDNSETEEILKAIEECKPYSFLKQCIDAAHVELKRIEERNNLCYQLIQAKQDKDKELLITLLDKAKEYPLIDQDVVSDAQFILDDIIREEENERMKMCDKIRSELENQLARPTIPPQQQNRFPEFERKLNALISEASVHPELADVIEAAQKHIQFQLEEFDTYNCLVKATDARDRAMLEQQLGRAQNFASMEREIEVALGVLDDIRREDELREELQRAISIRDHLSLTMLISRVASSPKTLQFRLEHLVEEAKALCVEIETENQVRSKLRAAMGNAIARQDDPSEKEKILKILDAAREFPALKEDVETAEIFLQKLEEKIEQQQQTAELEGLLSSNDRDAIGRFIAENSGKIPSVLLERARKHWQLLIDREYKFNALKDETQKAIDSRDRFSLKHAIELVESSDLLSPPSSEEQIATLSALLETAKALRQKLTEEHLAQKHAQSAKIITVVSQQTINDDNNNNNNNASSPVSVGTPTSNKGQQQFVKHFYHPLIENLYGYIRKLKASFENTNPVRSPTPNADTHNNNNNTSGTSGGAMPARYEVDARNAFGNNIAKIVTAVLADNTKNIYFIKERTPWDVFKGAKNSSIQQVVKEFEALNVLQNLPSENFGFRASLLFVQYLLDRALLTELVTELCRDTVYLDSCYEGTAVMKTPRNLSDFLDMLALLEQFTFKFGFSSAEDIPQQQHDEYTTDVLLAHPLSHLKGAIRAIVQYFAVNTRTTNDMASLGDDSKSDVVDQLIRVRLSNAIMLLMNHGFKSYGLLGRYHVWHAIEQVAESKKTCAGDLGGVELPSAVLTVNEIINRRKGMKDAYDIKFRAFICYALNYKMLFYFMSSLIQNKRIMDRYYDQSALLRQKDVQVKVLEYLALLSKLPFRLALDAEIY